jgi:hypothetical protein
VFEDGKNASRSGNTSGPGMHNRIVSNDALIAGALIILKGNHKKPRTTIKGKESVNLD